MKKKNKTFLLTILVIVALALAGCGIQPAESNDVNNIVINAALYSAGGLAYDIREADERELSEEVLSEIENYSPATENHLCVKKASNPCDVYYASLDSVEKNNFDQIAAQCTNAHPYAIIKSESPIDIDSLIKTAYAYIMSGDGIENYELCTRITLVYNYHDQNTHYVEYLKADSINRTEFNRMLAECTENAMKYSKQSDRIASIYSYIVDNIMYDYDFSEDNLLRNQSAGSVSSHKSVCAGISKFFQLCAKRVGIPCMVVTTREHAFNYVQMQNGKYYLLDATWDISLPRENWRWFLIGSKTRDINDVYEQHTSHKDQFGDFPLYPVLSVEDYDDQLTEPAETSTPKPEETPTPKPEETSTPKPEETPTPIPEETPTPIPEETPTPKPEETPTPIPEETSIPQPQEEIRITYMSVSRSSLCCKNDPIVDSSFSVEVGFSNGTTIVLLPSDYGQYYVVGSTNIEGGGEITYLVYYKDWVVECNLMVLDSSPSETIYSFSVSYLTECHIGDPISSVILSVEATMMDGTVRIISPGEYTIEGGLTEAPGETSFLVKYMDKTNNCSVIVLP